MLGKTEIRKKVRARVSAITDIDHRLARAAAERAYEFINKLNLERGAKVGVFLSMKGREIETSPLISLLQSESGRYRVLVPRVEDSVTINFYAFDQSSPHRISQYGIWEPLSPSSEAEVPEIIIVPGLAFDRKGGRVGHGKGFYDRYFERHKETIRVRAAFAYETQVFEEVPMDEFDYPMDALITDQTVTVFSPLSLSY